MYSDENIRKRIWLLPDGLPLKLDSMTIQTNRSDKLLVKGWTSSINFKNISKQNVIQELADLKSSFSELSKSFAEVNSIIKANNLTVEYNIEFNDSGKAGITLCSEIEGSLNWYI